MDTTTEGDIGVINNLGDDRSIASGRLRPCGAVPAFNLRLHNSALARRARGDPFAPVIRSYPRGTNDTGHQKKVEKGG